MWTPPPPMLASVPLPTPPRVRVVDGSGRPRANVAVAFTVVSGGGTTSANVVASNAAGEASVVWTLGIAAGVQELRASIPADTSAAELTFAVEIIYGPPASLAVVIPSTSLSLGTQVGLAVSARDAGGLTVAAPAPFTYASLDESVATVSPSGVVAAVGLGTTTITVSSGAISGSRDVTVHNSTPTYHRLDVTAQQALGVAVSSQRRVLIAGTFSSQIRSFDGETGAAFPSITLPTFTRDVAVRPDGSRALATAMSGANNLYELDLETNQVLRTIVLPHRGVRVVYAADGLAAFVTNDAGVLYRVDLATEAVTPHGVSVEAFAHGLALSRDGSKVAVSGFTGRACVVAADSSLDATCSQIGSVLQGVEFTVDGASFYLSHGEGGVITRRSATTFDWDLATAQRDHFDARLSPDGRFLFASVLNTHLLRVYRPSTLELLLEVNLGAQLHRIAFDGQSGAAWISTDRAQLTRILLY